MADFPRPGEEGFTSFPQHAADDVISYQVFLPNQNDKSSRLTRLREVLKTAQGLESGLLSDYVWHRESFSIHLSNEEPQLHLVGRVEFGDSLADEWAIVYLMRELSRKCDDCWICLRDQDGQFLLIEAANALPKWIEPDIASHRVWLNNGRLLILPPSLERPTDLNTSPTEVSLVSALEFVGRSPKHLIHSPMIEAEAFFRLEKYPKQIQDSLHTGKVVVPRKLAYITHSAPASISAAVEAFCTSRQRLEPAVRGLQCQRFPMEDLVRMSVTFNRTSFAQLKSQHLEPLAWDNDRGEDHGWNTSQLEVGMKVSLGYEALTVNPAFEKDQVTRTVNVLFSDIEDDGETLSTDEEISRWSQREDREDWLDVDFEHFEKELSGQAKPSTKPSFKDDNAQDTLEKLVAQFQNLLQNDAEADTEAAHFGGDSDSEEEQHSSDEDQVASFNEEEFQNSMNEMMGIPKAGTDNVRQAQHPRVHEIETEEDDAGEASVDDVQQMSVDDIQQMMHQIQVELQDEGALDPNDPDALRNAFMPDDNDTGSEDPRYSLAKGFLSSIRSQGDVAGSGGHTAQSVKPSRPRKESNSDRVSA